MLVVVVDLLNEANDRTMSVRAFSLAVHFVSPISNSEHRFSVRITLKQSLDITKRILGIKSFQIRVCTY